MSADTGPADPRSSIEAPPPIPGYEILGELGRGGMSVVYRARQLGLGRVVALKMIRLGAQAGPDELARFRREAEAVARLHHPNIVQVYELGEQDGRPFLALEFCDGGSLAAALAGQPQPVRRAAELTATLARAVHAAHEAGVVHRDLKPANVLLNADGTPRITDFGLAKKLDGDTRLTATGAILGTPSYMAPEQASGDGKHVGPAADVWALGAILYELLTGRPPFQGATPFDTLMQVLSDAAEPPSRLRPGVPAELEAICLRCLEKKPARRYASAAELADDLQRFLDGLPLAVRPAAGGTAPVRPWYRFVRNGVVAASLAAFLLSLPVLLVVVQLESRLRPSSTGERATGAWALQDGRGWIAAASAKSVSLRELDPVQVVDEWERSAPTTALAFSNDGGTLAIGTATGTVDLVDTATGRQTRTLQARQGPVRRLAFRDGGRQLVTATARKGAPPGEVDEVTHWDLATGRELSEVAVRGLLSPDGGTLAVAGPPGTLRLLNAATGQPRAGELDAAADYPVPTFNGEGTRFAFVGGDGKVSVCDAASGRELVRLAGEGPRPRRLLFSRDGTSLAVADGDGLAVWATDAGRRLFRDRAAGFEPVGFSADGATLVLQRSVAKRRQETPAAEIQLRTLPGGAVRTTLSDRAFLTLTSDNRFLLTAVADGGGARSQGEIHVVTLRTLARWQGACRALPVTLVIMGLGMLGILVSLTASGFGTGTVRALVFSPDGRFVASAIGQSVRVWDVAAERLLVTIRPEIGRVLALSFTADGKSLAIVTTRGTVHVCAVPSGKEQAQVRLPCAGLGAAAFSPDGRSIAGAKGVAGHFLRRSVFLWELDGDNGVRERVVPNAGHDRFGDIRLSADGQAVAMRSHVGEVKIWDLEPAGGPSRERLLPRIACRSWALSPDGRTLALSGAREWAITIRDTRLDRETCVPTIAEFRDQWMDHLALSPDGRTLAGSRGARTKLWDLADGRLLAKLPSRELVGAIQFSPDGRTLTVADAGGGVSWYDVAAVKRASPSPDAPRVRGLQEWADVVAGAPPVDPEAIPRLVRLVDHGLRRRRRWSDIVEQLVAAGVPATRAPEMFAVIRDAMGAGWEAARGRSGRHGEPAPEVPADPLLAESFRAGHALAHSTLFRAITITRQLVGCLGPPLAVVLALVLVVVGLIRLAGWLAQ
jgi:WD40 repeat protein